MNRSATPSCPKPMVGKSATPFEHIMWGRRAPDHHCGDDIVSEGDQVT